MNTEVKQIYVAIDRNRMYKPLVAAGSIQELEAQLDIYYGCNDNGGTNLGFTPCTDGCPDSCKGQFQYKYHMIHSLRDECATEYIDIIRVYCIDYWPTDV